MATILEFLQKYAVNLLIKLLKVIQDCHQNYCFKICILEETPNLWPWKYGDHNTLCHGSKIFFSLPGSLKAHRKVHDDRNHNL